MRIYIDTEFYEDGKTIDLMSIGMVREDGQELYLINEECDWSRPLKDSWHQQHTLPSIMPDLLTGTKVVDRKHMRSLILTFTRSGPYPDGNDPFYPSSPPGSPEFWGWYSSYDWVVLCQLFGRMIDLPEGWPMYCRDLKQRMSESPWFVKSAEPDTHNALDDARWLKAEHERFLEEQSRREAATTTKGTE